MNKKESPTPSTPEELVMEYAPYVTAYRANGSNDLSWLLNPEIIKNKEVVEWLETIKQEVIDSGLEEKGHKMIEEKRAQLEDLMTDTSEKARSIIDAACEHPNQTPQFDLESWTPGKYNDFCFTLHNEQNPQYLELAEWDHLPVTDDGLELPNTPKIQAEPTHPDNIEYKDPKDFNLDEWEPTMDEYQFLN
jgi:hypothetical protein